MGSQAISKRRGASAADARAVLDCIRRLVRLLRESSHEAERRAGISGAQLFVLEQLKPGRALSLRELAERTLTHESSVSVVAQRLVDAGLIARRRSKEDGRRAQLTLLAPGRTLLRKSPRLAQGKLIAGIEALPERQRRALASSLQALVAGLGLGGRSPAMFFEEGAARVR